MAPCESFVGSHGESAAGANDSDAFPLIYRLYRVYWSNLFVVFVLLVNISHFLPEYTAENPYF